MTLPQLIVQVEVGTQIYPYLGDGGGEDRGMSKDSTFQYSRTSVIQHISQQQQNNKLELINIVCNYIMKNYIANYMHF